MKHLLAFVALCLPIYILAQGFGSFSHDQPYFAKDYTSVSNAPAPDDAYLFEWWIAGSNTFQNVDGTVPADTNGSFAKYWGDTLGRGYNLTNASGGPILVTNVINSHPVMYFGTNPPLIIDLAFTQPYWLFMVVQRGSVTGVGQQNLYTGNAVGSPGLYAQSADPSGFYYAGGVASIFPGFPLNTPYCYGILYSNGQSYPMTNGVVARSSEDIGNNNSVDTELGGRYAFNDFHYHGGIAECMIYTNYLSSNSVWKAHNYLLNKYFGTNAP